MRLRNAASLPDDGLGRISAGKTDIPAIRPQEFSHHHEPESVLFAGQSCQQYARRGARDSAFPGCRKGWGQFAQDVLEPKQCDGDCREVKEVVFPEFPKMSGDRGEQVEKNGFQRHSALADLLGARPGGPRFVGLTKRTEAFHICGQDAGPASGARFRVASRHVRKQEARDDVGLDGPQQAIRQPLKRRAILDF